MREKNTEEARHTDNSRKHNPVIVIAVTTAAAAILSVPSSFDSIGLLAFFASGLAAALFAFGYFVTGSPYLFLSAPLAGTKCRQPPSASAVPAAPA